MNNNFGKKHLIAIIIIVCVITITPFIIILSRKDKHDITQKSELPILEPKNEEPIREDQIIDPQSHKKITKIKLPTSPNPHEAIKKWKSENRVDSSTITKESNYEWKVENDNYNLTQTFETENTIYHINCFSDYKEKLEQWKNQCYIKPGVYYSHSEIRNKFGNYSQTVYDGKNNKLCYKYTERWLFDSWNIYDTNGKRIFNDVVTYETTDNYYDTLPSPIKPETTKPLT